jgi:hypothetical protein
MLWPQHVTISKNKKLNSTNKLRITEMTVISIRILRVATNIEPKIQISLKITTTTLKRAWTTTHTIKENIKINGQIIKIMSIMLVKMINITKTTKESLTKAKKREIKIMTT